MRGGGGGGRSDVSIRSTTPVVEIISCILISVLIMLCLHNFALRLSTHVFEMTSYHGYNVSKTVSVCLSKHMLFWYL